MRSHRGSKCLAGSQAWIVRCCRLGPEHGDIGQTVPAQRHRERHVQRGVARIVHRPLLAPWRQRRCYRAVQAGLAGPSRPAAPPRPARPPRCRRPRRYACSPGQHFFPCSQQDPGQVPSLQVRSTLRVGTALGGGAQSAPKHERDLSLHLRLEEPLGRDGATVGSGHVGEASALSNPERFTWPIAPPASAMTAQAPTMTSRYPRHEHARLSAITAQGSRQYHRLLVSSRGDDHFNGRRHALSFFQPQFVLVKCRVRMA